MFQIGVSRNTGESKDGDKSAKEIKEKMGREMIIRRKEESMRIEYGKKRKKETYKSEKEWKRYGERLRYSINYSS